MKAYVFPGQGAQFPGMAKDLYEAKQRIERLLDSIKGLDNTNYAAISRFRSQIKKLERENSEMKQLAHSIRRELDSVNGIINSI